MSKRTVYPEYTVEDANEDLIIRHRDFTRREQREAAEAGDFAYDQWFYHDVVLSVMVADTEEMLDTDDLLHSQKLAVEAAVFEGFHKRLRR